MSTTVTFAPFFSLANRVPPQTVTMGHYYQTAGTTVCVYDNHRQIYDALSHDIAQRVKYFKSRHLY